MRYPNIYGIDMPTPEELIAHGRSEAEIERMIGCDWLIYQDLADLEAAVAGPSSGPQVRQFLLQRRIRHRRRPGYFERIRQLRSDDAKHQRRLAL